MHFFQKNHGVFVRREITMHKKGRKFRVFWHEATIRSHTVPLSWNFVSKGGQRCATGDVNHPPGRAGKRARRRRAE